MFPCFGVNMLTKEQVQYLAKLSRLELNEAEVKKFQGQLSAILAYVEKLREVNTNGVEPTAQATGLENVARADEADTFGGETKVGVVANVPKKKGEYVQVRAVFD